MAFSSNDVIHVIGTDAAGLEHLSPHLQELVLSAANLAAPRRLMESVTTWFMDQKVSELPELKTTDKPEELIRWLLERHSNTVVLASGDPLWFGIGRRLLQEFSASQLHFYPAPSSMQLAFARLGRPWQDAEWISLHGREPEVLAIALQKRPSALAVLTNPMEGGVETVRRTLCSSGLESSYQFWLAENLGHASERLQQIKSGASLPTDVHPLNLIVLLACQPAPPDPKTLPLFGIDDGQFLQQRDRPGLMTKREIRIQLLADLDLPARGILWDLGAGTGSVGLEALRLRPELKLLSVEQRSGGAVLIKANAERLGVFPKAVVEGDALNLMRRGNLTEELCPPNRVLLGGGGQRRIELLEAVLNHLSPAGRVVIPLATLEAVAELRQVMEGYGLSVQLRQHQIWRGQPLSDGSRLAPMNPVFILRGQT